MASGRNGVAAPTICPSRRSRPFTRYASQFTRRPPPFAHLPAPIALAGPNPAIVPASESTTLTTTYTAPRRTSPCSMRYAVSYETAGKVV